jgi:SAM-dependent methyltransferase
MIFYRQPSLSSRDFDFPDRQTRTGARGFPTKKLRCCGYTPDRALECRTAFSSSILISVNYYNRNAEAYFAGTIHADVHDLRSKFLIHVRSGGDILDAGCGSGRDALAFRTAGYNVTAFDASAQMCRMARQYAQVQVIHMTFQEVMWRGAFDGIWACASLLHVPCVELSKVLRRLFHALRPSGVLYASFKHGSGERIVDGRHFTNMTELELGPLLKTIGFSSAKYWITDDVRPGRTSEQWLNALAHRE